MELKTVLEMYWFAKTNIDKVTDPNLKMDLANKLSQLESVALLDPKNDELVHDTNNLVQYLQSIGTF